MAAITRIEVANFLCDGYEPGKPWVPLYRGETLRLAGVNGFGCSTAVQIENAGGKTSLAEACLFLLTRNSQLKAKTSSRIAPADKSWTHVRIEFVERPIEDDPAQRSLVVIDQKNVGGTPYVIGFAWARGREPFFYRYQGVLDDAQCFMKHGATLSLIDNDPFRTAIKRMPGAKWDTWRTAKEWEKEIKFFCDTEVLKQNVQFQLDGAGDYSAVFNRVNNKNGNGYDVNFFRQIVAPELLRDPLGSEAREGEERFEQALLNHLRMSVDRLLDISACQRELDAAAAALLQFEPVEQKAQEVVIADGNYRQELDNLARDAAVVNALVRRNVPGLPNFAAIEPYRGNKKLVAVLSALVISQRHGILICDSSLAKLSGVETFRLNGYAQEKGIHQWTAVTQPIDFQNDVKRDPPIPSASGTSQSDIQPIENKDDVKPSRRGGRRSAVSYYDLDGALKAVAAVSNLHGADTTGLEDLLTRAFGIVIEEVDTNPYRREQLRLQKEIEVVRNQRAAAEVDVKRWSKVYETLLRQRTDAKENQTAYETFRTRAGEFLAEHINDPLAAKAWGENQLALARSALEAHHSRIVELTEDYNNWCGLNHEYIGAPLQGVLDTLVASFKNATRARDDADEALTTARKERADLDGVLKGKNSALMEINQRRNRLEFLAAWLPMFTELFGDSDPDSLDPGKDFKDANTVFQELTTALRDAVAEKGALEALKPGAKLFREVFDDAEPVSLNPTKDLSDHNEKIGVENEILAEHQPLVEALELFIEANPTKQPEEWLAEADSERQALGVEQRDNERRAKEIARELAELESADVADNRVYAAALQALTEGNVGFSRLHTMIAEEIGDRRAELLTLFSSALSAPVVDTLDDAGRATEILEQAKLTVPVFLKGPWIDFIKRGEYNLSGKLAHNYLVGRRTRQVEMLLNRSLVVEERGRLNTEATDIAARMTVILERLHELQPTSSLMEVALRAKRANERKSVEKYAGATRRHDELSRKLPALERRATPQAIASIGTMKSYIERGGENRYNTLIAATIPQLEEERAEQSKKVERLEKLIKEEATRALHSVKDYKREGGDSALTSIRSDISILESTIEELSGTIQELDDQINSVFVPKYREYVGALDKLNETYEVQRKALVAAISFQATDGLAYMMGSKGHGVTLNEDITRSGNRLTGIDFERAAEFSIKGPEDARDLADRIAEAEGKRTAAEGTEIELGKTLTQCEGRLATITPFVADLHGLAVAIRTQHSKIAGFPIDIRHRMVGVALDPDIITYADAITNSCMGNRATADDSIKAAISNLAESITELEIDPRPLHIRVIERDAALSAFRTKREEFCEKARSGEIQGLQLPEIERIAASRTISELEVIHQVKDKISASISEHRGQLEVYRQAMEEAKVATIDNMTHFARQADRNLTIMERVMAKSPNARFYVHAKVADADKVREIIESLIASIQDREAVARDRGTVTLNEDLEQRNHDYIAQIHTDIYQKMFSEPSVYFSHKAIRGGDKTRLTGEDGGLSGGQRTALMMMWLIKQADYALTRAVMNSDASRAEKKTTLRGAQRIMFFDGLFSNLTSDEIINNAFQGLSDVDQNFQLIGLIHNPAYVNNKDIFPVHLVGKRYAATKGGKRHCFMSVGTYDNKLGFFQSAYRGNSQDDQPNA